MQLKVYLTAIALSLSCTFLKGQCEKEISTNPLNPVNDEFLPLKNDWYPNHLTNPTPYTVNSFLNESMNWSPGTSIILDLTAGWSSDFGLAGNYIMRNPFANNHHANHLNSPPRAPGSAADRDWRWVDGWELLWMNIGKYPNGDSYNSPSAGTYFATGNAIENPDNPVILDNIAPPNVPYFVLYNRYRGIVRLFANVWQNNLTPSDSLRWASALRNYNALIQKAGHSPLPIKPSSAYSPKP